MQMLTESLPEQIDAVILNSKLIGSRFDGRSSGTAQDSLLVFCATLTYVTVAMNAGNMAGEACEGKCAPLSNFRVF